MTWAGGEYTWNSAHVIATLVLGTAVSAVFICWQYKGTSVPLIPSELQSVTVRCVLMMASGDIHLESSQWCYANNVCEWLELSYSDLLHTVFLPISLWLLSCQVCSALVTHYNHTKYARSC